MAKVIAPNKQYTGLSASVMFVNGVGETDDPHLLAWFALKGYMVEGEGKKRQKRSASVDEQQPSVSEPRADEE